MSGLNSDRTDWFMNKTNILQQTNILSVLFTNRPVNLGLWFVTCAALLSKRAYEASRDGLKVFGPK
jgi:hypothetical protein